MCKLVSASVEEGEFGEEFGMRMMAASAYRCLPRTSGVPSAAHCGIRDEDRARFRVLPVGLGAGSRRSFENGRVGQCISKWASGEFRRRVFGQRNAVALPYRPGRRELKVVAEEKFDVAKGTSLTISLLGLSCEFESNLWSMWFSI